MKKFLFYSIQLLVTLVISGFIGGFVAFCFNWFGNTIFINKLTYKWQLEEQYNKGKYNERLCKIFEKPNMNEIQKDFCKRHNDYKNHPKSLGE